MGADHAPARVHLHHVVAYDLRGAGASSAPRGAAAYDFDRLGDDLLAVVEAVAPAGDVHVVGHDWGRCGGTHG